MADNKYIIADMPIMMNTDDEGLIEHFSAFTREFNEEPLLSIDLIREPVLSKPPGDLILNDSFKWVSLNNNQYDIGIYIERSDNSIHASMEVNRNWSKARVKYILNDNIWKWKSTLSLLEVLFRNSLLFNNGIVIHSSAIEWQGKSIVFTAPAGTGKTTQSNLWKEHMQARVLNGDRPALKVEGNYAFVYGTPWSGSSKDYINEKAPLAALVLLEQSPNNEIKQLNAVDAIGKIMPRFFLPYNDRSMMDKAMTTIESIIRSTPVFLLKCRPDKGAVDTLYEAI